jgi:hypothetical protein
MPAAVVVEVCRHLETETAEERFAAVIAVRHAREDVGGRQLVTGIGQQPVDGDGS